MFFQQLPTTENGNKNALFKKEKRKKYIKINKTNKKNQKKKRKKQQPDTYKHTLRTHLRKRETKTNNQLQKIIIILNEIK